MPPRPGQIAVLFLDPGGFNGSRFWLLPAADLKKQHVTLGPEIMPCSPALSFTEHVALIVISLDTTVSKCETWNYLFSHVAASLGKVDVL